MTNEEIEAIADQLDESDKGLHLITFARAIERETAKRCAEILTARIERMKQHKDVDGRTDFYALEIAELEHMAESIRAEYGIE